MSSFTFTGPTLRPMHTAWALVLTFLLALALLVIPRAPGAQSSSLTAQETPAGAKIELTEFSPTLITPGDTITLKATVTNLTDQEITAPSISFNVMRYRFSTRTALERWQNQDLGANPGTPIAVNKLDKPLAPGKSVTTTFSINSDQFQLLGGVQGWGPRGVTVLLNSTDEQNQTRPVAALFTYLVWNSTAHEAGPSLALSTVIPVTGPALDPMDPLAVAETVLGSTADGSRLSNVIAAVKDIPDLTVAADPQFLERAYLTATSPLPLDPKTPIPEPAESDLEFEPTIEQNTTSQWFQETAKVLTAGETYALPDYDADLAAYAAADLRLPAPQPRDIADLKQSTWRTDLMWPEPDSVTNEFLGHQDTANSVIMAQPPAGDPLFTLTYTPNAAVPNFATPESTIVVPDQTLSDLVSNGAGNNPIEARQRFVSELAVIAKERPSEQRSIVLTVPRSWNPDPAVAQAQLGALSELPWLSTPHLSALTANLDPAQEYYFADQWPPALLTPRTLDQVLNAAQDLSKFAGVVDDPNLVTEPMAQTSRAITSVAWRQDPAGRSRLAQKAQAYTEENLAALSVDTGTDINLISTGSEIPLTVRNRLSQDAHVLIQLVPDNPRLQAKEAIPVTVPAGGSQQVRVPVTAVGSGNVQVQVNILTAAHKPAAHSGSFTVRVRADWENLGTAVVVGLLVLILGAGIIRTVRRGKSARRTDPKDASESLQAVQRTPKQPDQLGEMDNT